MGCQKQWFFKLTHCLSEAHWETLKYHLNPLNVLESQYNLFMSAENLLENPSNSLKSLLVDPFGLIQNLWNCQRTSKIQGPQKHPNKSYTMFKGTLILGPPTLVDNFWNPDELLLNWTEEDCNTFWVQIILIAKKYAWSSIIWLIQ